MKNPVTILNVDGDKGRLKAAIIADRCIWSGIEFHYALVGTQHTVTVAESNVKVALGG